MKLYGWLGIGALIVLAGWKAPTAQAQTTSNYTPLSASFQTTGVQRTPTITSNYYGLVRSHPVARPTHVLNTQQRQQVQAQTAARLRANTHATYAGLPWFATNWYQIRAVPVQRPRRARH